MAYGSELRYMRGLSWRGRLVYAFLGETSVGHRLRFLISKRVMGLGRTTSRCLSILDIGSSRGQFCFWLSRFPFYSVVGLDCNENLIRECEHVRMRLGRSNIRFICADAATPYTVSEKFNLIFSSHLLEHIPDDISALNYACKHLKSGGRLILQVPYGDPQKPPSLEMMLNAHVRDGYTPGDIRQKVENAGFQVEVLQGSVGFLGGLAWRLGQIREPVNIVLFPIVWILLSLEQVVYLFRNSPPHFSSGILLIARKNSELPELDGNREGSCKKE